MNDVTATILTSLDELLTIKTLKTFTSHPNQVFYMMHLALYILYTH